MGLQIFPHFCYNQIKKRQTPSGESICPLMCCRKKIRVLKNPTMVGLDPTPEVVPGYLLEEARRELGVTPAAAAAAYSRFCRELLEGLRDVVPAVKVQSACFDALGSSGVAAMQEVWASPGNWGIMCCWTVCGATCGTAELCARAAFGTVEEAGPGYQPYPCDAVTINGYLGGDSVKPLPALLSGRGEEPVCSGQDLQPLLGGGPGFTHRGPPGAHRHGRFGESVGWGALWGLRLFPGGGCGGRALSGASEKSACQV